MIVCPFCGFRAKSFEAFGFDFPVLKKLEVVGGGERDNAICPKCRSVDRERLVYLYLKNFTRVFEISQSVLHIAPEKRLRDKLEENRSLNYTTADLVKTFVDINFDLCDIPFEQERFDIIICNHILEHIVDDKKAMSELYRVLKPKGLAILQVPFSPLLKKTLEDSSISSEEGRAKNFGQKDHVRIYGLDYIDRLREAGFEVEKFIWTRYDIFLEEEFGLCKREPIFIARRG